MDGRKRGGADELSELYRELQLLRLKYDQLVDVCRKLTKSWPNRGSDGRLLKTPDASKADVQKKSKEKISQPDTEAPVLYENSPQLQLLDSILKKAQNIKVSNEELQEGRKKLCKKRFATENCKKAEKVYQTEAPRVRKIPHSASPTTTSQRKAGSLTDHRPRKKGGASKNHKSSAISCSKSHRSLPPRTPLPSITVVRHTNGEVEGKRTDSPASSPRTVGVASGITTSSVSRDEDAEEDEEKKFHLHRDGSRLRLPSRYTSLRTTLLKLQEQVASQTTDPSTEAMREHFVNRLLPPGRQVPHKQLELELARQEYQLLTGEVKSVLGCELPRDAVRARERLESIVHRASAVEEKVASTEGSGRENPPARRLDSTQDIDRGTNGSGSAQLHTRSTVLGGGPQLESCRMAYSSLAELLQLVEVENRLRMARIETQLLKFCTEVVLPKYQIKDLSTTSVQILSELAGKPKPIFICSD